MKAFGKMNREEKLELLTAWLDGEKIEYLCSYSGWQTCGKPMWAGAVSYRVKPVVQDSINWSHVHEDFKYMARDEDGRAHLYKGSPHRSETIWSLVGYQEVGTFSSYKRGDTDWKDSLVCRP